jgi:hypothetical protein
MLRRERANALSAEDSDDIWLLLLVDELAQNEARRESVPDSLVRAAPFALLSTCSPNPCPRLNWRRS